MATITDPLARERPIARPSGGIAVVQSGTGPGTAGMGLRVAGEEINQGANELYHAQKAEEDRINTLAAEDAFTKMRQTQLDLTHGDQGFTQFKGASAVTRPLYKEYTKKFDDAESQIASGLHNDEQRTRFKLRADVSRLQYEEEILRHGGQQADVYAREVYDGTMVVEQRNAVANWDSPPNVDASLTRIQAAVDDMASHNGWDAEFTKAKLMQEQAKVHTAVVQQAIASGNYKYAEAWYKDHKDDIDLQTAKVLEIAVRDGDQKQKAAEYTSDFLANRNSLQGLEAIHADILKDQVLDLPRQNMLLGQVLSRMDVLQRRAQATHDAAIRQISHSIDAVNGNTWKGFESTMAQMQPIYDAAKGTELEGEAIRMVNLANMTGKYRVALPAQQVAMETEFEAMVRKDPVKYDIRTLDAFKAIRASQAQQVQDNPYGFAVRQGYVEPAPLDLSRPKDMGPDLRKRFVIAETMAITHQAPNKPITPEEAKLISTALAGAKPEEKSQYFGDLSAASGDDDQGRKGYSNVMAMIAPDDPVTAKAGDFAGKKRTLASDLMLRGQSILNPTRKEDGKPDAGKLWPLPPEKMFDEAFRLREFDAYAGRPKDRNADYQATLAIYAALVSKSGKTDKESIDGDTFNEAFNLATGGVEHHNGRYLVMPYGYTKVQFDDELSARVDQIIRKGQPAVNFDSTYDTLLDENQEQKFQQWKQRYAPKDSGEDYDLRGAFKEGILPSPKDGHWPDTFKKPNHPTFSDQSKYADFGTPGTWKGEAFYPPVAGSKPKQPPPTTAGQIDRRVTKQVLMSLPLYRWDTEGVYAFKSGDQWILDRANRPILVNFNVKPEPSTQQLGNPADLEIPTQQIKNLQ